MYFCWDYEPTGNVEHVHEHGLTTGDVEQAFENVVEHLTSDSSGRPAIKGLTADATLIFVVYEIELLDGEQFIAVVTAFKIGD